MSRRRRRRRSGLSRWLRDDMVVIAQALFVILAILLAAGLTWLLTSFRWRPWS